MNITKVLPPSSTFYIFLNPVCQARLCSTQDKACPLRGGPGPGWVHTWGAGTVAPGGVGSSNLGTGQQQGLLRARPPPRGALRPCAQHCRRDLASVQGT